MLPYSVMGPEHVPITFIIDGKQATIMEISRYTLESRMDIYPGESRELGVAGRFDGEAKCYGWCNENYFSNPPWRNQRWRLPEGRYLIRVTVISSGEKCIKIFRLINDVPQDDFRIEEAMITDSVRD